MRPFNTVNVRQCSMICKKMRLFFLCFLLPSFTSELGTGLVTGDGRLDTSYKSKVLESGINVTILEDYKSKYWIQT